MTKKILPTFIGIIFLLLLFCSENADLVINDGGGTEITGYLVSEDGAPAAQASVWLIDQEKKNTFTTTTDQSGKYRFQQNIPHGRYTLQGIRSPMACIIFNLDHPFPVRTDTLKHTGCIYAIASFKDRTSHQGIEVYIPKTTFFGKTDSSGTVTFCNIPAGTYDIFFERLGYVSCKTAVKVLADLVDTIGPVFLDRNYAFPVIVPVPTGLQATIDTFLGTVILSWNKFEKDTQNNIQGYYVHIIDPAKDHYPQDGLTKFIKDSFFIDTVYDWENPSDTISTKGRKYQVCAVDDNNNSGQWGPCCSVVVNKPVVPPAPSCSLLYLPESISISIFASVPQLWWVDSLIVYRSIAADTPVQLSKFPKDSSRWEDMVFNFPMTKDSLITITYSIFSKSVYGYLSPSPSRNSITIKNPYLDFNLEKPSKIQGLPSEAEVGVYVVTIPSSNSPIPDDFLEYRLLVSQETDSSRFFTDWYTIPSIEVSFQKESRYLIQCQYRSKKFPEVLSPLSDTFSFETHKKHLIPKPSTPSGKSLVSQSTPCSYISDINSTCSNGHQILIRYVVSYQGESASDSTDWLALPNHSATILWAKPGIAYLRAQARCSKDPLILSPWSDALVVTVQ